MRETTRRRRST